MEEPDAGWGVVDDEERAPEYLEVGFGLSVRLSLAVGERLVVGREGDQEEKVLESLGLSGCQVGPSLEDDWPV